MVVEDKLCKWLTAGLALYKANPRMIESVFFDASQCGWPRFTAPNLVVDEAKRWLPDEYAGGVFRWGGESFPIVGNAIQALTLGGDAESVEPDGLEYQIVPPAAAGLTQFLDTEKFSILSSFAQVPTQMPAVTIRLEKDEQGDTYIGDSIQRTAVEGVEFAIRSQALTGSYLLSIWTQNREATLWTYSWLQHYALNSLGAFNSWGLYDVGFSGSDLDPALQYLAERTYTRHLLLTASRIERAVTLQTSGSGHGEVEWVHDICLKVLTHYQTFDVRVAPRRA